jgi:hypothetical protein
MNASTTYLDTIRFQPAEATPESNRGRRWRVVKRTLVLLIIGIAAIPVAVLIVSKRDEWRRTACRVQLRQLGVAFLNYHEAQGHFPAPAIVDRAGKPLLSWRVALLPKLGYPSLYARFHLDEPWDSPHNRALLSEMPAEFACPSGDGRESGQTHYRVIVGPAFDQYSVNTAFAPDRGVEIREITDGTFSSILAIETETSVPWTKPNELHWAPGGSLPVLKSMHGDGTHIILGDGSPRYTKHSIETHTLLALITINGGEVVGG